MTRHRRIAALVTAGVVALAGGVAGPACGTDNVVVATIPSPDAGPLRCIVPSPDAGDAAAMLEGDGGGTCQPDQFCEPAACGATTGTCQTLPLSCPDGFSPVCGCDGVTYFSDCLRRSAGVQVNGSGVCLFDSLPKVCATVAPSAFSGPPLLSVLCAIASLPTFCWVLPPTPPSDAGGLQVRSVDPSTCPTAMVPTLGKCTDAYTGLKDGGLLVEINECP